MGVNSLADEIRKLGLEFFERLDGGLATLDAWRERATAAYEEVEARETTQDSAGVPEGAPPQYEAVRARVEDGDYSWYDVMSADVTDPDAPTVVYSYRTGDQRGLFYLHGGLHLFTNAGHATKHCWSRSGDTSPAIVSG